MIEILDSAPKIDSAKLEWVESLFRFKLPNDYKTFLLRFNGGRPLKSSFDFVGVDGLQNTSDLKMFYSIGNPESEDNLETNITYYWENERLAKSVIPIAVDYGGNLICMSILAKDYGAIYFWDHEFELELELDENLAKLDNSFIDFIDNLYVNLDDN